MILESWRRSRRSGVDPNWGNTQQPAPAPFGGDGSSPLRSSADPVFRFLREALSDHPFLLMLTDSQCRPLELVGSGASLREGEWINAVAGGHWTEDLVGTDAVALGRALGEPVQVHWYEHYAAVADPWTGNAAPIRDGETGEILGTMNLYAYGCISHPQALEIVTLGAKMIEARVADAARFRRLHVLESFDAHLSRFPAEPAICLTRNGIVLAVSPKAAERLRLRGSDVRGRPFAAVAGIPTDLFSSTSDSRQIDIDRGAERLRGSLVPVRADGELSGFLLELRGRARRSRSVDTWTTRYRFDDVVGESPAIIDAIATARIAAARDCTVLITGETGTGKELFAQAIHAASARSTGPFVAINCGALSEDLLSSELFGYEDGAFTGAARSGRAGKLELADGGTVFLDEVEAMSAGMQTHLLRFLEDRQILRVGADRQRPIDVRIISATNVDLRSRIERRRFRSDLFYRLNVFPLVLPPLRVRRSDIAAIARRLLDEEGGDYVLAASAITRLERHSWPGNVRELRNVLLQAVFRARHAILEAEDLFNLPAVASAPQPVNSRATLVDVERRSILDAVDRHAGRLRSAAAELGIHRVTLYRKLKRYGLRRRGDYRADG